MARCGCGFRLGKDGKTYVRVKVCDKHRKREARQQSKKKAS